MESFFEQHFNASYSGVEFPHSPCLPIVQSSGMGKTRTALELLKRTEYHSFYACIGATDSFSAPDIMHTFADIIKNIKGEREWFIFFLSVLTSYANEQSGYNVFNNSYNDSKYGKETKAILGKLKLKGENNNYTSCFRDEFINICNKLSPTGPRHRFVLCLDVITAMFKDGKFELKQFCEFTAALSRFARTLNSYGIEMMCIIIDCDISIALTRVAPEEDCIDDCRMMLAPILF